MDKTEFKKSFHLNLHETTGLSVYNTGNQQCSKCYKYGPAVRDFYLIHYVISGKGIYKVDDIKYCVNAGEAFLIYPDTICTYIADSAEPWQYSWVAFNGADAKRLVELTDFSLNRPVLQIPKSVELEKKIEKIYSIANSSVESEIEMVGRLYLLWSALVNISKKPSSTSAHGNKHMKSALRFIHDNFSRSISVNDISKHVGISPSYLYRLFMKTQNISPSDYLTEYRIDHACVLLRTGKYIVGEVANSVGYEDQLYFSRSFKKIKGIPPSEYMHKHIKSK